MDERTAIFLVGGGTVLFAIGLIWLFRLVARWVGKVNEAVYCTNSDYRGNNALWHKLTDFSTRDEMRELRRRVDALERPLDKSEGPA